MKLTPVWAPKYYKPMAALWCGMRPENYWGYEEWGFDTPHFGVKRVEGKSLSLIRTDFTSDMAYCISMFSDFARGYLRATEGSEISLRIAVNEVARTRYQQEEYVRTGKSRTMNSDHLEARAFDAIVYKVTWDSDDH